MNSLENFTGRYHGQFYQNGVPRGLITQQPEKRITLYEAVLLPPEQVAINLGLQPGVKRLEPVVVPRELTIQRLLP